MSAVSRPLAALAAVVCTFQLAQAQLTVYQNLDEATARIARLGSRPSMKLIDSQGYYQNEVMIFHDIITGKEVWSLTNELSTDLANIERRCAWSSNGQYISFIGNKDFYDPVTKELRDRAWAGYTYVANANGSGRFKLWGTENGKLRYHDDKFNNWDAAKGNVLYYCDDDRFGRSAVFKVTLGDTPYTATSEVIHTFSNKVSRIIQEVSDDNYLLIEEGGTSPNCVVINLNKKPGDTNFVMTYPLAGEVHPGSFRFRRSDVIITGGYENAALGSIRLKVDPVLGLVPTTLPSNPGVTAWHLWYGPPDDRMAFSGSVSGKGNGLFVQMPGQTPVKVGSIPDGHPTWCGQDPDTWFYAIGPGTIESKWAHLARGLIAVNAAGTKVDLICVPYDRRRSGTSSYASIPRPNQSPDASKVWFHSSMLMPTEEYTGSYVAVYRRPYAPVAVQYTNGQLTWAEHTLNNENRGYFVYRQVGGQWQRVNVEPVDDNKLTVPAGTYMVTSLEWSGLESDESSPVLNTATGQITAAVKNFDTTAPAAPSGLKITPEDAANGQFWLEWNDSASTDVRYYSIYFSSTGLPDVDQRRLIMSAFPGQEKLLDWSAPIGTDLYYAITAIDYQGNESAPAYVSTVPEPATMLVMLAGGALALARRRGKY